MSAISVRRTTAATYTHDDDREFDLPILDPYDNYVVEDSMVVVDSTEGTVLRYAITDEDGGSLFDQEELFHGWTDVHVLHSQRDADKLSSLFDCQNCYYDWDNHLDDDGKLRTDLEDWIGCEGWEPSEAQQALDDGRAFFFERYEHGLVRYALQGESSAVDRMWDVTGVAGFMRADGDWGADVDLEQAARETLARYTDWCNGSIYCIVEATYTGDVDEEGVHQYVDYECVGGFIGYDEATEAVKGEA